MNPVAATEASISSSVTFKKDRRPKPLMLALSLVTVLMIWSFNYVAGKVALRHIDAMSLASMRMPLAALLMLPICFAQG